MSDGLLGRRVLVDIQEYDRDMRLRRSRNFSGEIIRMTEGIIHIRRDDNGVIEELLASDDDLEDAPPGEYWLRSTGASIPQPDLLAEWKHYDELRSDST